jgi:hypothetical protein
LIQYTRQLNRIKLKNKAINLKLKNRAQQDRRDQLIDSASPEPRALVHEGGEETMKMMVKKGEERKGDLKGQLDQIKEGMDMLKMEMEYVRKGVEAFGQ